ncbi:DNA-processing protein DprA [Halomonas sp. M4R5S39]|uniref:DNA-processing protein DprA n=1 Tax=Halomonas kalidii TaxID=3043293 RepID=A0ABT6VL13_9GAMM|nr:DNA-processing protein DprA [Halomonas kalidii]MDI5934666.1 DNA-processing protein DprA [Halomonas kalidii]MDI5986010.1 DNA-processing protein DprA [Halomonas kalidii]
MTLSTAAQATLLLTSYFSKPAKGAAKPLTPTEWGHFAQWLHETNHTPGDLLSHTAPWVLGKWSDEKIPRERLEALLQRGSSMALALEKWQRSGLWIITRSDPEYPRRLKKRLKHAAPPVLYGCGNAELLNAGGLAVVGSRKAGNEDLTYARMLGAKANQAAVGIVSGGARGIDEAAMQGAIQEGGPVIGILSEGLLKAATSSQWRQGLMSGGLVLVSPYYPEASFNTGNAMGRNKYIYCLADAAVVVHSGSSGGTKAGAEENLRKGWVPLWVKPTQDPEAGNQALVDAGGTWCEQEIEQLDIGSLFAPTETPLPQKTPCQPEPTPATEVDAGAEPSESVTGKPLDVDVHGEVGDAVATDSQQEPETEEPETNPSPRETDAGCLEESTVEPTELPQPDLFGSDESTEESAQPAAPEPAMTDAVEHKEPPVGPVNQSGEHSSQINFYRLFLSELQRLAQNPRTADDITTETGLHKTQVNAWLKQAVEEGRLKKLTRPVRYQAIPEELEDPGTVDDDVERLVRRLRAPHNFETSS